MPFSTPGKDMMMASISAGVMGPPSASWAPVCAPDPRRSKRKRRPRGTAVTVRKTADASGDDRPAAAQHGARAEEADQHQRPDAGLGNAGRRRNAEVDVGQAARD